MTMRPRRFPTLTLLGLALINTTINTAAAAPVVPGFARFHADAKSDAASGGRLLIGELNCTSCHAADAKTTGIRPKQAPILTAVGSRVRPQYLRRFLADPHAEKPGTTMPNLLARMPAAERKATVESLVHFLASTGRVEDDIPNPGTVLRGEELFHQIGCVACHGSQHKGAKSLATSVPLGDLPRKYSWTSLATFLGDPLAVRPSGRMPHMNLRGSEARDIAGYLLRDLAPPANVNYKYYEGNWGRVPDFSKLTPKAIGRATEISVKPKQRSNGFGLRFEGFLRVPERAIYKFYMSSDDGSKLWLDNKRAINHDGVHGVSERTGRYWLPKGMLPIRIDYFQGSGEGSLSIQFEGPGIAKQDLAGALFPSKDGPTESKARIGEQPFSLDVDLSAKGKALFGSLGCASCHQLEQKGQRIASTIKAKPLAQLAAAGGCLNVTAGKNTPHYSLSDRQRQTLSAAIGQVKAGKIAATPAGVISETLTSLNCYACHERDKKGGVETERNELFLAMIKEMGDEGRLPPHISGVGAKLTPMWLAHVLKTGERVRPYMPVRMPAFGEANIGHLAGAFAAVDKIEPVKVPEIKVAAADLKATGRHMTGNKVLGCVKCHNFGRFKGTGIQAINLQLMTKRLNHDWYHRYMLNPAAFRPGTRMPTAWPDGNTFYKDILGGSTTKQIESIWAFLSDGTKARTPVGIQLVAVDLIPRDEAVIYRNFITGAGPRAIGVGYPEGLNLAFDAQNMRLALIWKGAFIDPSRHWNGRGQGYQGPKGTNVKKLATGASFAVLETPETAWPTESSRKLGFKFRGYRVTDDRRPTFMYDFGLARIEDFPNASTQGASSAIVRTITVSSSKPTKNLYYRAAVGSTIEPAADGWFRVDGSWKVKIEASAKPIVRKSGSSAELLVPIPAAASSKIVQTYDW